MPNFGCPPGDTPIECWDGSCVDTNATCNLNCKETQIRCWNGDCDISCEGPYWRTAIPTYDVSVTIPVFNNDTAEPNYFIYHIYKQSPQTTNDIMGILLIANQQGVPFQLNATVHGADFYDLYYQDVGPIQTWPNWTLPAFLLSSPITITSDSLNSPSDKSQLIHILFKEQKRTEDIDICFAIIDDWYWDDLDNQTFSPFKDVEIFKQYRENGSLDIVTPPKRWRCLDSPKVTLQQPAYLGKLGLKGLQITQWGTYALIQHPNFTVPTNQTPSIPATPQIPIIIAGGVLFIIILLAMIIAHATDDNSPNLSCSKK